MQYDFGKLQLAMRSLLCPISIINETEQAISEIHAKYAREFQAKIKRDNVRKNDIGRIKTNRKQ